MRKRVLSRSVLSSAAFIVVTTISIPAVMVSCEAETAGRSIEFSVAAMGATESGESLSDFENTKGWRIQLTQAAALYGPIYFYSGEPMASRQRILPGFGIAAACPTHAQFDYGAVLGEVMEQYPVDLLADRATSFGEIDGEAGTCRSAELHLHPMGDQGLKLSGDEASATPLENGTIRLEGVASKGDESISFRALITIPNEGTARIVQNISANTVLEDISEKPGQLVVSALLDVWFSAVDFSTLEETDEDGAYLFTEDTQAWTALVQAVRNRYAYRVEWSKK